MAHEDFEIPFTETQFHVDHLLAHVHEGPASGPLTPPLPAPIGIIRTDQDWSVHVHFHTTGSLVPVLQGVWHLDLYLERMGPGPDLRLPIGPPEGLDVPLTPGSSPQFYNPFINISAGTVPASPSGHPTAYKLVITVAYRYCRNGAFGLMAGFVEGPMIQFYTP